MLNIITTIALLVPSGDPIDNILPWRAEHHGMQIAPLVQGFNIPMSASMLGISKEFYVGPLPALECTECKTGFYLKVIPNSGVRWEDCSPDPDLSVNGGNTNANDTNTYYYTDLAGKLESDVASPEWMVEFTGVTKTSTYNPNCDYDETEKCVLNDTNTRCHGTIKIDHLVNDSMAGGHATWIEKDGNVVTDVSVTELQTAGPACGASKDRELWHIKATKTVEEKAVIYVAGTIQLAMACSICQKEEATP